MATTDSFPTTPQTSRAARVAAVAIGLATIALGVRTTITSAAWVGRVFPGFMLLDNRVVASVALAQWSGTAVPGLYQSEVIAVDGVSVHSTAEIYARVARQIPGTVITYRLRRDHHERDVLVATQVFTLRDWFLLFGAYLLNGATYLATGLIVWVLRPRLPLGRALLFLGIAWAVFLMTAMDLYGPATFFRLHVAAESMVPPVVLQLALLFPQPHRLVRWRFVGFLPSLVIVTLYESFLYTPSVYTPMLYANMGYLSVVSLFLGGRLVVEYWKGTSQLARQRVRVVTLGTLCGFAIPGAIVLASVINGGAFGMNLGAFTQFLFSLSLAYAVVKHDLFEIDAMVKRGAYYLVLTGAVGAAYILAVVVFNLLLQGGAVTQSPAFPIIFTIAVLLVFNPLRTRLQAVVDRVFFRTTYSPPQVLAEVGAALGSSLQRERIAQVVRDGVRRAIPNPSTRLFATHADDGSVAEVLGEARLPSPLITDLRLGRILTAFDTVELYEDAGQHDSVRSALVALDAEIAVPLHLGDRLVGALTVGAKRSGLFYTAGDAEFLRALAHQAAIALENARTYEAVVALNASLEERVRERTAQLQNTNEELARAYGELKNAEVQLVHSEKMASLGRLVAGVAHEINNPVSFIVTSVAPLQRRLGRAAEAAPPASAAFLREAQEIAGVMARGAERTAGIVKDLRSFSRLDEATRKTVDLADGIEVSLRLLETRWRGRITIHRDYEALPPVECDPGQLNQVFMNLLANACDAITGDGNIWITTRLGGDVVRIAIRDDGAGIPADVRARIFEPFFTTKDAGSGTGLGLAITHTVMAAHGGQITVDSAPGTGATFTITLPITGTRAMSAAS